MKHVTLRSSSATNAGSGQASGKHSQLSLPFPSSLLPLLSPTILNPVSVCVCASTAIGALDRFRVARPLTCRLWSPYSMRRRYILFILFSRFFFLYFVFVFRFVCGFTDCREAFARLFSPCFVFFFCVFCYV